MIDASQSRGFTGWRFIFTLPFFDESTNSFSRLLAPVVQDLRGRGAEVRILSSNSAYAGPYRDVHTALRRPRFPVAFLDFASTVVASTLWVARHRGRRTIVHNLGVGSCLLQDVMTAHACHAAWVARKRIYGRSWTTYLNPLHPLVLLVERLNYARCTRTIAVSGEVATQIHRHYHRDAVTIPNGLPPESRTMPVSPASQPRGGEPWVVAFASNDHGKKGLGELLEALSLAKREDRRWTLRVFGRDPREARWRRRAERLGLGNRVTFVGHVDDLKNQLARADVFCLPSHYEAFGLVYLEAAAAGIPVIGTHGVYPELVGSEFELLPLRDPVSGPAIFEALKRIADDASMRRRLVEHVARRAQTYTEENMVAATRSLYSALIAARS